MPNKFYSVYALSLLLLSGAAFAEQPRTWYSVEYIVFANKPLGNQYLEPWSKAAFSMPENAQVLNRQSPPQEFSLLRVNQQQLHGVFAKLKSLSAYQPLAHGGWIQSLGSNHSPAVQINYQTSSQRLEGTLRFHRGKYLHLDADLQLSDLPGLLADDQTSATRLYRLKETRRIKTSKSNYFDHPRFGIITLVEKIDSPMAASPTDDIIDKQAPKIEPLINPNAPQRLPVRNEN